MLPFGWVLKTIQRNLSKLFPTQVSLLRSGPWPLAAYSTLCTSRHTSPRVRRQCHLLCPLLVSLGLKCHPPRFGWHRCHFSSPHRHLTRLLTKKVSPQSKFHRGKPATVTPLCSTTPIVLHILFLLHMGTAPAPLRLLIRSYLFWEAPCLPHQIPTLSTLMSVSEFSKGKN